MRHNYKLKKLGRTASHRRALLANLVTALFEHVSIKTTVAKAKEARKLADRLINIAKRNDLHARRLVLATVRDKKVVRKLFSEIAPRYADRSGGYTRVVGLGHRYGDGAEMAILELVGYEGVQKARIEAQREKREAKKKEKEKEKAEEKAPAATAAKEE